MKIGFLGNMNNASFAAARYLRDEGYDCEVLIYNTEPTHFAPDQDTFSSDFETFTRRLSWGDPAGFLQLSKDCIKNDTAAYDFIIGNGPAPAAMEKINRRLDVFAPYGYDLYSLPFYKIVHPFRIPAYWQVARLQQRGISKTSNIIFDKTNADFERLIQQFAYPGNRIISTTPMLYDKEYAEDNLLKHLDQHPFCSQLEKIRAENEFLIVQHARHVWKSSSDRWSGKGNNILLKAFKLFLQQNPTVTSKLLLFEYGLDVAASKKLIYELDIVDRVVWFPRLPRKQVMGILWFADLVVGELQISWLTGGVSSETLCLGKPLMQKRTDADYLNDYDELYPMIYAHSEETVLAGLQGFINDPKRYEQIGKQGRAWFEEYYVRRPLGYLTGLINGKK